jgi:hypothetical protein
MSKGIGSVKFKKITSWEIERRKEEVNFSKDSSNLKIKERIDVSSLLAIFLNEVNFE